MKKKQIVEWVVSLAGKLAEAQRNLVRLDGECYRRFREIEDRLAKLEVEAQTLGEMDQHDYPML